MLRRWEGALDAQKITLGILGLALLLPCSGSSGQTYNRSVFDDSSIQPIKKRRKGPAPPPVTFSVVREIPLPGKLPEGDLELENSTIRLPVKGGVAEIDLSSVESSPVRIEPGGSPGRLEIAWVHGGPENDYRFRSYPEGRIEAERRGFGWNREWRRRWRLRTPGGTPSPPLVDGKRVYYGCTDNRIYAIKAKNGHRVWASDIEERITRPLALWRGSIGSGGDPGGYKILLAIPDGGIRLVAIDPFDGKSLATYRMETAGESLVSPPAVLPDGRIVAAVQKYRPSDAALLVLEIVPVDPPDASAAVLQKIEDKEVNDEGDR